MIVDGKEFEVGYEEIAEGEIDFDPDNPRRYEIALELESRGQDPNEARKADGIEKATRFQELVKSVVENGGISIPMVSRIWPTQSDNQAMPLSVIEIPVNGCMTR